MKKMLHKIPLLAAAVMLLLFLTGCGDPASPVNVVIVDGNARANFGSFSYNLPAIGNLINSAAHCGYVGQVSVEGTPRETASFSISDLSTKGYTSQKLDEMARSNQVVITQTLQSLTVTSEEADVLKAVQLGARSLQAKNSNGAENWLIILDNMLATKGVLDFATGNLLDANADVIVQALQERSELPDLTDVNVIVFGCGDTIEPQQPLNAQARDNLKEIWNAIFHAANAKTVEFRNELPSDTEINELLPRVSTVSVITDRIAFPEDAVEEEQPVETIVRLDDTAISFVADEATLRDPSAAREAILPFAELLRSHPEQCMLIAGSTATAGTREGCLALSQARAAVISELLVAEGVDPAQLICIGLGQEGHSLRIPDTAADGSLIETEATKNRCVYMILLPSTIADELLQIGS